MLQNNHKNYENEILAPWAMRSHLSKGRKHEEPIHPYRGEFQRDRERIIHSASFRRLEYKTQVFVNHEGDHYRTRLTHTIEVARIARSMARALNLNEDLTEGIALAHDLGHTPFGHSGEAALNRLMKDHGGFEHNRQSLKVVEKLERRYPDFPGLNLTFELREGILKHETIYDSPENPPDLFPLDKGTLECQVVNVADEIAYTCHDVDDGLSAGLFTITDLLEIDLWRSLHEELIFEYPDIMKSQFYRYQMVKKLINMMVTDALNSSEPTIEKFMPESPDVVRKMPVNLICRSEKSQNGEAQLKQYLLENMYHHYRLIRMAEKAERIITTLFEAFIRNPDQLPPSYSCRLSEEDEYTVVADYIAGMTDRYAGQEYNKLTDPFQSF